MVILFLQARKRKQKGWGRNKVGARDIGENKKKKRKNKKSEQYKDIVDKLAAIGDPYDDMSIKKKRELALHHFFSQMKVNTTLQGYMYWINQEDKIKKFHLQILLRYKLSSNNELIMNILTVI